MKLTTKDKEFLERLRDRFEADGLEIAFKEAGYKRMVLRKAYGQQLERAFRQTRQGVRWRFNRVFNDAYVSAYLTILLIETSFGTQLRQAAMAVARDRYEAWRKARPLRAEGAGARDRR